jgi:hypothetical protein
MSFVHLFATAAGLLAIGLAAGTTSTASSESLHVSNTFEFTIAAPLSTVAPLFGAQRERVWAEGWNPQFIYPEPAEDKAGAIFTIQHGGHTSTWITTIFEPGNGHIQHVYFIPDAMAVLIDIRLQSVDSAKTRVRVTYERTALSPELNDHVRKIGEQDASSGPHWQKAISDYLDKTAKK